MIDFCLLNGAKLYEEDISYVEEIIYLLKNGHIKYKSLTHENKLKCKDNLEVNEIKIQHENFEAEIQKSLSNILISPLINIITDFSTI